MLFLYLLNPFFAWIFSLSKFRDINIFAATWMFVIFFGMTYGLDLESGVDAIRYIDEIKYLHEVDWDLDWALQYFSETGEVDLLRIFLAFLVSSFTGNGHILMVIYAGIFGYFYAKNLSYILSKLNGKIKFFTTILLFAFMLIMPFWKIGGFRFNTGLHVFIYGLLPYVFENSKRRLVWTFVTPIVFHFAFLLPLAIFLIFNILGYRIRLYFVLFVLSFIYGQLDLKVFNDFLSSISPEAVNERTASYTTEDKVEAHRSGEYKNYLSWHARLYKESIKWSLTIYLLVLFYRHKKLILSNPFFLRLFCISLVYFSVANIMNSIPAGERYYDISNMLVLAFMIQFYQNHLKDEYSKRVVKLTLPLILLFVIVSLRESWYHLTLMGIFGNPIVALIYFGNNTPLDTFIK